MNKTNVANKGLRTFPGDGLILNPKKTITHSVTIHASPEQIWPWLIQMGAGRGGWYSYDKVDNAGIPSAGKIIPEFQQLKAGDLLPAIPKSADSFIVREISPRRSLVLVVPVQDAREEPRIHQRMTGPLRASWTLVLEPVGPGKTRLISRARIHPDWLSPPGGDSAVLKKLTPIERVYSLLARMPWFLVAPIALAGHYFMETRMLHGIKRRVEAQEVNKDLLNRQSGSI